MADLEKVLGKTGAKNFWNKVWSNVKVLTGDVAYKTKGDLQTQVTAAANTASTAKTTADAAKTAAENASKAATTAKETAEAAKTQTGGLTFAQDADGNWGYKVGGADPVIPFKSGTLLTEASGNEKVDSFSKSFAAQSSASYTSTINSVGLYFVIAHTEADTTSTSSSSVTPVSGCTALASYSRGYQASATTASIIQVHTVPARITMAGSNYRAGKVIGYVYKII